MADEVLTEHKDREEKQELLMWAAARGLLNDAKELLGMGADPAGKDKQGRTAAHYAAAHNHPEVLEFLATKGVDLDAEDNQGRGPLHYASLGGHTGVVELLAAKGMWVDAPDGADDTPLHLACRGLLTGVDSAASDDALPSADLPTSAAPRPVCRTAPAAVALLKSGAKMEVKNSRGLTPLGEAVVSNNVGAVTALLTRGAKLKSAVKGYSLLHVAAGLGHSQVLKELLARGGREDVNAQDNPDGCTPLHAAVQHATAHGGTVRAARALVDAGANAGVRNAAGSLPHDLLPTGGSLDTDTLRAALIKLAGTGPVAPPPPAAKEVPAQAAPPPANDKQADVEPARTSSQAQFRALPVEEQRRKVLAWSRLPEGDLRLLPFPPASCLPDIRALKRATDLVACWEAVAAIRQDAAFQEEARDPAVQQAIEDLKRPGADVSRYAGDRVVQSVFAKVNKMYGVLRLHGQGFKVKIDDLLADRTGPKSVADTLRQLSALRARADVARDAAIAAVAGLPPAPAPGSDQASSRDRTGAEDAPSDEDSPAAKAVETEPAEPRPWREWFRDVAVELGWHVMRALGMVCLMLAAMWMLGLWPEQLREQAAAREQRLKQTSHEQELGAVSGAIAGALRRAAGKGGQDVVHGLEGLGGDGREL